MISILLVAVLLPTSTQAQFFSCSEGAPIQDLQRSMEAHNEHVLRLDNKFTDIWYLQGQIPAYRRSEISVPKTVEFLSALKGRQGGILVYASEFGRLCIWLITTKGVVARHQSVLTNDHLQSIQATQWQRSGARDVTTPRLATRSEAATTPSLGDDWKTILRRTRDLLLPVPIVNELFANKVDTLIVVPITIRQTTRQEQRALKEGVDIAVHDQSPTKNITLAIAATPFTALPIGDGDLRVIDFMSVIITPGLSVFSAPPEKNFKLHKALVVGNPNAVGFERLPGAEAEAKEIAELFETKPLLGSLATRTNIESRLKEKAAPDLIHLATHGLASSEHPLDGSFLIFSDGRLTARNISKLGPLRNKPLVIMSACQTALGKHFEVGTTGLARAWQFAGASNVIMSLWNVHDAATRVLMVRLTKNLLHGISADQALRRASRELRKTYDSPSYWASFAIFGAPEN